MQLNSSSESPQQSESEHLLIGLAIVVAVAVRLVRVLFSVPGADECLDAMLSLRLLEGHWHTFFFGQEYMGTLDAVLATPLYALLGPAQLLPSALAVLYNFLILLVIWRCLAKFFPPLAQGVGLFYYALPPAFFAFWAGEGMNHYHLGQLLCALILWLSLDMWQRGLLDAWRSLAWGFMAGLAAWTNFQTAVVILPCAVFLILTCWRRLRSIPLGLAVIGGLTGASPLIYYNLTHAMHHAGQTGIFRLERLVPQLDLLATNALPIILGFNTPISGGPTAPGHPLFWLYLMVASLAATGCMLLFWQGLKPEKRGLWLPLLIGLTNMGVITSSTYGWELSNYDQRYLMPLFLVLPFVWAQLAQTMMKLSRKRTIWAAAGLTLFLLAVNFGGYFDYRGIFALKEGSFLFRHFDTQQKNYEELRRLGINAVYSETSEAHAYLAGQNPQFSRPFSARRLYASVQADASLHPAFDLALGRTLVLVGVKYKLIPPHLFYGFDEPEHVDRQLRPESWQAHTLSGGSLGEVLWDQDLNTGFTVPGDKAEGSGFVMDLGREQMVAGFALLLIDHHRGPGGLLVEAAGEDGVYRTIREAPNIWGPFYISASRPYFKVRYPRTDCYFPTQTLRYLRITHLVRLNQTHPWVVDEVLLWGPGKASNQATWNKTGELLLQVLTKGNARRVYADAWPAAYVRVHTKGAIWTITADAHTDEYKNKEPPPETPIVIDPSPGSAVVVPQRAAQQSLDLLQFAGIKVAKQESAGHYVVLWTRGRDPGPRLELKAVTASEKAQAAAGLAKGSLDGGRWAPPRPQTPGPTLTLDLGLTRKVARVELHNQDYPKDWPRGVDWLISSDGENWRQVKPRRLGPIAQAGPCLAAYPALRQSFIFTSPIETRFIRLRLAGSHPVKWWSVQNVTVHGPMESNSNN